MHRVPDSSCLTQDVELLAFATNRIQQHSPHGRASRGISRNGSVRTALVDLRDLVFVLVQQVVVEVTLRFVLGRVSAICQEANRGLQQDVPRSALFTG